MIKKNNYVKAIFYLRIMHLLLKLVNYCTAKWFSNVTVILWLSGF